MQVKDVMTRIVLAIPPESSVQYAARMMKFNEIGMLLVGTKEDVAGVITDRDLTVRVTAETRDPVHTEVREVMSSPAIYCFDDQDIEDACFMMEDTKVRRLVVCDRKRDVVGVLSLDDVASRARKDKLSGHVLSKLSGTT
jgi:signal-transduction protein with cAMP-binding, CBS, and nucleotidyltransferase domain